MDCQLLHLCLLIFLLLDIYHLLSIEVTPKFTQAQRNKMQCREAIKMSVRLCKSRSRANPIPIVHSTAAWAMHCWEIVVRRQ